MRVLITGSTMWDKPEVIYGVLASVKSSAPVTIIEGEAKGADIMARKAAEMLGYTIEKYPAQWERYGKKAGYIRNVQMADAGADICLAFWDGISNGTFHTMVEAWKRDIPVYVTMLHDAPQMVE